MDYLKAFLMIVGALSILFCLLLVSGAYCLGGRRNSLDRFNNPEEPKYSTIKKLPWVKR